MTLVRYKGNGKEPVSVRSWISSGSRDPPGRGQNPQRCEPGSWRLTQGGSAAKAALTTKAVRSKTSSAMKVHLGRTESSAGKHREQPGKARAGAAGDCQDKNKHYLVAKEVFSFLFCACNDYEKQSAERCGDGS